MGSKSVQLCDCKVIHHATVEEVGEKMLSKHRFAALTELYKTLGDNTRIRLLWALDCHEMCVCDLAVLLDMTKSAISHQLKMLKDLNLVRYRREGKNVFYSLMDEHVKQIIEIAIKHIDCEEKEA